MNWKDLKFFGSGEWDVVQERLDDLKQKQTVVCPQRADLFKALEVCPYEQTKVIIVGQDPYPNPAHATGIAFSIPDTVDRKRWPPTLVNLLTEYQDDLHYPEPSTGTLVDWCRQGVLLWNSTPTCTAWRSLSHAAWTEYSYLNKEIMEVLSDKGDVVFVFLGNKAQENIQYVRNGQRVISLSHPSPRGSRFSKHPFIGSRMFTTINTLLKEPINWRLN